MANEPITREEILLNAVATGEQANIKPITREEMFLAKAGGQNVQTPTPITRREMFLSKISCASGGGGNSGGGGGGGFVEEKDIRFMDYDGTLLYSYSVDEFAAMTELPPLPEQKGLICQGWNWSLEDIKAMGRAVDVGAMYITDDGKTRIYITLQDGRTSPMLCVCPKGTVTVDWGDGSEPDVLTGTYTWQPRQTPTHDYSNPGDYVITLTVDGQMGFSGSSGGGTYLLRNVYEDGKSNAVYQNAIRKVEIGSGAVIEEYAFQECHSLASITIPNDVLKFYARCFNSCTCLTSVIIPNSVTSIGASAFYGCYSMHSISIPNSTTSIGDSAFWGNYALVSIIIPSGVTSIGSSIFYNCYLLTKVAISEGIKSIPYKCFSMCTSLVSIIIPSGVTSIISDAFQQCCGMRYYDFTTHTAVPTLSNTSAFTGIPADCEIRVPAALYDEWIAATNWATYAANIVAV